jgi:lipopolysaccharide biosynthesis glycosyltransferase
MEINIATYSDGYYMQHACVMLASLNTVVDSNNSYHIFLFYSDCSDSVLQKAKRTLDGFRKNIDYKLIKVDFKLRGKLKSKRENINDSIYDKMVIYNLLHDNVKRIFFLDADIVLKKDPAIIYNINLKNKVLAAVQDRLHILESSRNAIDLEKPEDYFNSGVMIVNLEEWRNKNIADKALKFALEKGHLTKLHDQDALNHAIKGNWVRICPLWNPRPQNIIENYYETPVSLKRDEIYRRGISNLVHFSGSDKPWNFLSMHPAKTIYWFYLKQTEFKDYTPDDQSILNLIKLKIKELKNSLKKLIGRSLAIQFTLIIKMEYINLLATDFCSLNLYF